MYLIPKGTPIQRKTSDGAPLTDRTDGETERTDQEYELFPEGVLLTPDKNGGVWVFVVSKGVQWEIGEKYVKIDTKRSFFQ